MLTTLVHQKGNSKSIQIPSELRTKKKDFFINRIGDVYEIYTIDDP